MDDFTLIKEIQPSGVLANSIVGNILLYSNSIYNVSVTHKLLHNDTTPSIIHLVVSRHDQQPISSWSHMQHIKNVLVGDEYTGVEVFPPESQLTDAANCYHIWVYPDADFRLPFSLNVGRVVV